MTLQNLDFQEILKPRLCCQLHLFLGEAIVLALMGGALGLLLLFMLTGVLHMALPGLPVTFNVFFLGLALFVSALIGLIAGVFPAGQAANLDPIKALHEE